MLAALLQIPPSPPGDLVSVIVRSTDSAASAGAAVLEAGGQVVRTLNVIDAVAAQVPEDVLGALGADHTVTRDHRLALHGGNNSGDETYTVRTAIDVTGADSYWARGATGDGVGVALIDTGVAPVQGIEGQVIHGPDLSFEASSANLRHLDTFGHGTHMAGLIAGRDPGASPETFASRPDDFLGMAPGAHVISLKVADSRGATDVSQVIAAIDWVITHRDDPGLNIRVLNLSFGTYPDQGYETDPLAHAAEAAWDHGIVVVAAAGNDGDVRVGLTSPAYSPRVIAVGAVDTHGSTRYSHWNPLSFSARGDGHRNPDLLAPGSSLASLRVPGSFLDQAYGDTAVVDGRFFKGSGTSQAAALVSGAAALIVGANPTWTPDMVKDVLLFEANGLRHGAGFTRITGKWALRLHQMHRASANVSATQRDTPSTGGGSLDASRGGAVLLSPDGVPLTGEVDIFGAPVDTAALAARLNDGGSWVGGTWNGNQWSGNQWSGNQWSGNQWSGSDWAGNQWSSLLWSGNQWSGNQWSGNQWSGNQWSGNQWSDATWSAATWR